MKIRTRLSIILIITFTILATIAGGILYLSFQSASLAADHDQAMMVAALSDGVNLTISEYVISPNDELIDVWYEYFELSKEAYNKRESFKDLVNVDFDTLERMFIDVITVTHELENETDPVQISILSEEREEKVFSIFKLSKDTKIALNTAAEVRRRSEYIANYAIRAVALIGLLWAVLSVLLSSLYMYRVILRSLNRVQKGVKEIQDGNFDYQIKDVSSDEIGVIAHGFNSMAKELKNYYRTLNTQVKQRTASLNRTMKVLDEEKGKIQTLLDNVSDGIVLLDKDYKILLFNKSAQRISGFSEKDVVGKNYNDNFSFETDKGKDASKIVQNAVIQGEGVSVGSNVIMATGNGKKFPVAFSSTELFDEKGNNKGFAIVFRDITTEYEVDQMKTDFVSVTSHQLKTPLTFIRWAVDSLVESVEGGRIKLPKSERETLDDLTRKVGEMIKLINTLLNISRIETGRLSIDPEPHSLRRLISGILKEIDEQAKEKNIQINFLKPINQLPPVTVDKVLLTQAVKNFLTNAVKYTKEGGAISIILEKSKIGYQICVEDSGIGIPADKQAEIFKKYFRSDEAREMSEGSGLGLYVAKMVMEQSGGKVWFTSEEGKGSNFCLEIPLKGMRAKKGEKGLAV